jgi:hypothetical protein
MSRFADTQVTVGVDNTEERIRRLEELVYAMDNAFFNSFIRGRVRTDRTTPPATSTDINTTDKLGDVIYVYPYEYILINNAGTYNWVRISIGTF